MYRHNLLEVNGNNETTTERIAFQINVSELGDTVNLVLVNLGDNDEIILHKEMPMQELAKLGRDILNIAARYGYVS